MPFRSLYEAVVEYDGTRLFKDILSPGIPTAAAALEKLDRYKRYEREVPYEVRDEDLWELYALSVLNDQLILPLRLSLAEYHEFANSIGLQPFQSTDFAPHLHEIVAVGNWTTVPDEVRVVNTCWPGLKFGNLVLARSGVEVVCQPELGIVQGIADRSTLWFANHRINRVAEDLSHGWGHNSRWRTRFHRTYEEREYILFNAEGTVDLRDNQPKDPPETPCRDLPIAARREALVHRCFVQFKGNPDECWPYDDTLKVRTGGAPWPLDEGALLPVF